MVIVNFRKFFHRRAIIDANVIIDFYEIEALSLLEQVFAQIFISEQVVHFELRTVDLTNLSFKKSNILSTEGYRLFFQLGEQYPQQLSQYDREILAIAHENSLICVTNEQRMRQVCKEYDILAVGTLGVLGCAKQTGLISKKRLGSLVDLLEHSSCYLGKELLRDFRDQC